MTLADIKNYLISNPINGQSVSLSDDNQRLILTVGPVGLTFSTESNGRGMVRVRNTNSQKGPFRMFENVSELPVHILDLVSEYVVDHSTPWDVHAKDKISGASLYAQVLKKHFEETYERLGQLLGVKA